MNLGGRPRSEARQVAERLGISTRAVRRIGVERIARMSADALAVLVGMSREASRKAHDGIDEPGTALARRRRLRGPTARPRTAHDVARMVELARRVA